MATFKQEAANLIDQRGAISNQAVAHAMQGLHVELLLGLQLDETHRRPCGGFGDCFGIAIIVLLRFDVGPDVLRRHQTDFMPETGQFPAHMMRAAAGLHSDDASIQLRREGENRRPSHSPLQDDCARLIKADDAAAVLPEIHAQYCDLHSSFSFP